MVHAPDRGMCEQLVNIANPENGLFGVIAIHVARNGLSAGGCRFWSYPNHASMVEDAIRLARGMSYKNALAGLPFGGGKAVLNVPSGRFNREAMFQAFGDAVAALGGRYVTAEDVGTTIVDMRAVRSRTRYVAGLDAKPGEAGGDPSPWTALGVFESMKAAAHWAGFPLHGATVAVQGVGNVGARLCQLLHDHGANLAVADIDPQRTLEMVSRYGARSVAIEEIAGIEADVFAPCALGGGINDQSIPLLKAKLICGGANNQLLSERHGDDLRQRGIVYAPDYVVNAGGIINVIAEHLGEGTQSVESRIRQIAPRLISILDDAAARGAPTSAVADDMARTIIANDCVVAA